MLGAGLAGLSLADSLSEKGYKVLLIDRKDTGSGASGTPIGLVNPATGQKANLSWQAENCYHAILNNLTKIQRTASTEFFCTSGIIRPALDEKSFTNFRQAFERDNWPEGWCQWLSEDTISKENPYLAATKGGLFVKVGLAVNLPSYLNAYVTYLRKKSVTVLLNEDYKLDRQGKHWIFNCRKHGLKKTGGVIFACGHASINFSYWKNIPIHPVKGQISIYETKDLLSWDIPIAASGYFARSGPNQFVVGGTYEHDFEHEQADSKGFSLLNKKLQRIMPTLLAKSILINQWAGIRASTPNRLPILGAHAIEPNLFIFSGLGSKGILYSKYTADLMADYLLDKKAIPDALDISRLVN
ncbi:MAG: FAD-dependent oxidoreductase [Balneolales bacterium]